MDQAQLQTLATALRASANSSVINAIAARNDTALAAWLNASSNQLAWNESVFAQALFEAIDITKFDGLSTGKRDAYRLMLDFTPIDFNKIKNRKALQDIWGNTDSVSILTEVTRKATNGEKIYGGTDVTTNTVTAWKLNYVGGIGVDEVSNALNNY
jgi:hypothetical protein